MRTRLVALLLSLAVGSVWAVGSSQTPPAGKGRLLVLSKGALTLSVVDPVTLKVIGKVPSGPDPHEVAATPDGRRAYISNYGTAKGGFNTLTVADLVEFKPLPPVDLGPLRGPHGMTEAGGKIYFTAEVAKAVGRVDPATNKVDWALGTGQDISHMVVVAPDLKRMFTVNVQSASASIIERAVGRAGRFAPAADDDWTVTSVKVGEPSDDFEGFDVSPDGRELWTASPRGKISIVDTIGKKIAQSWDAGVTGANRVKFTPDGKRVLISRLSAPAGSGGTIVVFDAATRKEIKKIDAGAGVGGILMQPDGARAYGASSRSGFVVVIDLHTLEVVGKIDAGPNPDGTAWTVQP
ncbi:MAG: YncE family protein [Acidobacteria bacterium]|nr:YncE family protein [Acidobacteriota bacterium]